jgi:acyl-CoA thioester hydrolase
LPKSVGAPPKDAVVSTYQHRVPFFETDAMGIVHHANYVLYLERARVLWLDEHDQPYRNYIDQGIHYATTRVEVDYQRAARFDDLVEISVWLHWIRGASLRMNYQLVCAGNQIATASTVHASMNADGRVRRLPRERAEHLRQLALHQKP